jgi:hypothetical protein
MFAATEYLRWADKHYGKVLFDLGRSGVFGTDRPMLDIPKNLEDFAAWDTLHMRIAAYNGVAVDEVIPTFGASHALWVAYTSLISPGDEVLIERVTYEPMYRIAEGIGAKVSWFERDASSRFELEPICVARAITDRTRVVALTNLHNPSGVRADESAIRAVAQIAAAHNAYLLIDEVYAPFDSLCDEYGVWGGSARNLAPNIVTVGSLTKCYGLGGHRMGWVLGPQEVIAHGNDALLTSLGSAPLPWMAIGVRAFDCLPTFAAWSQSKIAGKRERIDTWFSARPYLMWTAPREGLFGFVIDTRTDENFMDRIERGIRQYSIVVAPGAFFGVPNAFRLAWAIEEVKLDSALNHLAQLID